MRLTLTDEQLHRQVRYFGYYQLLTGLFMLGLMLFTPAIAGSSAVPYALFFGCLGLAGFIVYCGYLTLRQPRRGLLLSRYQLLGQLLGVAIGGFAYQFFAGPYVTVGLDLTGDALVTANAALGGSYQIQLGKGDGLFVYVNLVALLLFLRTTQWLNEWDYRYPAASGPTS